ncbi:MAG: WG repeat-containing protein [Pyrinomonadaceae bacterium]
MNIRSCVAILFILILAPLASAQSTATNLKPVFKKGLWGYADTSGRLVIAPQFDAAAEFVDGLARVGMVNEERPELDGRPNVKWGYIDQHGQVAVPLIYAVVRRFVGDRAAVATRPDNASVPALRSRAALELLWGYVDRKGEVKIPLKFLNAGDFAEGLAVVNVAKTSGDGSGEGSYCSGPRNYGYIDATGAFVIEPQYTIATNFIDGRARVGKGSVNYVGRCLCCNPRFIGTYGHVDRAGKFTPDAKPTDGYGEELDLP